MKPEFKKFTAQVGEHEMVFETGRLAQQAGGAVTVQVEDALIFGSATMSSKPRENQSWFPLSVDYEEKMYAGGRIPGSFFRREGRPGTDAILTARLTDRPIRPLFEKSMRNDVQIIMTSLSADMVNPLDILVVNAASAALAISDIPWDGPIGAVRVGRVDGEFVINPTFQQMDQSDLDLRLAGTSEAVLMVECGAEEVPEDVMVKAIAAGQEAIQPIISTIKEMVAAVGKEKREVPLFPLDKEVEQKVYDMAADKLLEVIKQPYLKANFYSGIDAVKESVLEAFTDEENPELRDKAIDAFEEVEKQVIRGRILNENTRPDGRGLDEIRNIWCEVGFSPRAHGSAIFTRGETQALTVATLGTPRDSQELDNLSPGDRKRYMHHYNFPPFCTGETKPMRSSSRREIGHGSLAERALEPVIPNDKEFPYTLRLVSEIMSSNGSSSMASVCGSSLALMDTGVPIKAPVTGIAMGLVKKDDKYAVLSDIMGMEDHLGDMDFKVTGTEKGITALQMDIKIKGITQEIMSEALQQAKEGRQHILGKMQEAIDAPNETLKPHVPRITSISIPVDKIGAVIGPGGKTIRSIQEETGATIDIQDDGTVIVATENMDAEARAKDRILALTESPEPGQIYTGKVVRTTDFGAFVEILPNVDGLVHISQLDSMRVNKVEDVAHVGDELMVMIVSIDQGGKIRLSRQAVLEGWTLEEAIANDAKGKRSSGGRKPSGGNRGGGQRYNNRR